jgi:hypothetical protein
VLVECNNIDVARSEPRDPAFAVSGMDDIEPEPFQSALDEPRKRGVVVYV